MSRLTGAETLDHSTVAMDLGVSSTPSQQELTSAPVLESSEISSVFGVGDLSLHSVIPMFCRYQRFLWLCKSGYCYPVHVVGCTVLSIFVFVLFILNVRKYNNRTYREERTVRVALPDQLKCLGFCVVFSERRRGVVLSRYSFGVMNNS